MKILQICYFTKFNVIQLVLNSLNTCTHNHFHLTLYYLTGEGTRTSSNLTIPKHLLYDFTKCVGESIDYECRFVYTPPS